MQKVLDILEKYVEWIALALGAAFFGWMGWTYLINSPASKVVGGQELTPATVDKYVFDNKTQHLQDLIASATPPKLDVPDFGSYVPGKLGFLGEPQPTTLASVFDYSPAQISTAIEGPGSSNEPVITQLPNLPQAAPLFVMHGASTVMYPGPAANPQPIHKDIHWATVAFSIPESELKNQWTQAFGPDKPGGAWKLSDGQRQTRFLSLVLYRSEKLPDGSWSNPSPVQRLANEAILPYPQPGDKQNQERYEIWAAQNASALTAPKFYDLAPPPFGKTWTSPDVAIKNLINPAPAQQPAAEQPQATPAATPATPAASDGGESTPQNTPAANQPDATVVAIPNFTDPTITAAANLPTVVPAELIPPAAVAGGGAIPASGTFDPAPPPAAANAPAPPAMSDILVYLNDDTVVPGHTYQYTLKYRLGNPLFNMLANRASVAAWVDQFDLASPISTASPEITIDPDSYFYCADAGNRGAKGFTFDVFTWSQGSWHKNQFTIFPGDEIGNLADGVNYSTGFTYVDGKAHQQQFVVTVVDDTTGDTTLRRADEDASSPDHKLRQQWVDQAKIATNPGGNNNGGGEMNPPSSQPGDTSQ
jgi:hypothetical protein